jgi:hypothetical protein
MAMKPTKTFFLSNFPPRVSFFHFRSQQLRILAYPRVRTISPGDHLRDKIQLPAFGLAGLGCVMKRFGVRETNMGRYKKN